MFRLTDLYIALKLLGESNCTVETNDGNTTIGTSPSTSVKLPNTVVTAMGGLEVLREDRVALLAVLDGSIHDEILAAKLLNLSTQMASQT